MTRAKIFVFFDDITFSYSKLYSGFSGCALGTTVNQWDYFWISSLMKSFVSFFSEISILSKRKNMWNRQKSKNGDDVVEPNKCRWLRWMNEHQTSFVFWCVRFIINQYSRDSYFMIYNPSYNSGRIMPGGQPVIPPPTAY